MIPRRGLVVAVLADVGLCPLIPSCPALLSPGKNVTRYYCTNQTTVCPVCVGSARCVFQYVSIGSGSRRTWLLPWHVPRQCLRCLGDHRKTSSCLHAGLSTGALFSLSSFTFQAEFFYWHFGITLNMHAVLLLKTFHLGF